jgi:mannose-1-phosphate guanylyltransferase/phosphomannomutase
VVDYAFGPDALVGPAILGRLGCEALAVNPFTDEHRPVLQADDLQRLLGRLSEHVRNSGSDSGVLIEPGGEIAHLVDGKGRVINLHQALLAFVAYRAGKGDAVAVPVNSSMACERLVRSSGGKLLWTPTALSALMSRAARPEVGFAGNAEGTLIFPRFMPAPDALMTFGQALEMVATQRRSLSEVIDELPAVHITLRNVRTPWQLKGAVMRRIASMSVPGRLMLLDGVKVIEEDRWALILPHPEEPLCRVWAEAPSPQEADALADRFARRIEAFVDDAGGSGV